MALVGEASLGEVVYGPATLAAAEVLRQHMAADLRRIHAAGSGKFDPGKAAHRLLSAIGVTGDLLAVGHGGRNEQARGQATSDEDYYTTWLQEVRGSAAPSKPVSETSASTLASKAPDATLLDEQIKDNIRKNRRDERKRQRQERRDQRTAAAMQQKVGETLAKNEQWYQAQRLGSAALKR